MSEKRSELLLASVIIARSTSYLFTQVALRSLHPFNLMAVRFGLAFLILLPFFIKRLRAAHLRTVFHGMLLGGAFFSLMALETTSLQFTASSTVSFLENTAIVWVPLLLALIRRHMPQSRTMIAAMITLLGVFCLTLGKSGFRIGRGELLCLCGSLCYSVVILLTAELSRVDDPLVLGFLQIGFLALFSTIFAFGTGRPVLPSTREAWGSVLYLVAICSIFGFTMQPVAQRGIAADKAGLFCALSPLSAMITGILVLKEMPGAFGFAGAGLILTGIVLRALPVHRHHAIEKVQAAETRLENVRLAKAHLAKTHRMPKARAV